jgi:8-oxo-dGTP pyrophosphatase MutT (NUDIX family)
MTHPGERPERFAGHRYPQTIPEPLDIQAGLPAPWSFLPLESRVDLSFDTVISRLRGADRLLESSQPPDEPEELGIVADDVPMPITQRSAVLAALFEEDGEAQLVLTRRSMTLRYHRGEIALPGGRCELDETPTETALREAQEEIGLDPSGVTPLAWLSPIVTFASGSSIWPVVATLQGRPTFTLQTSEVDRVFSVALKDLAADGAFIEERWRRTEWRPGVDDEGYFPIYFFKVPGDVIWGATARVVAELLALVTGAPWPRITDK